MKISARLNHLFEHIMHLNQASHYDELWDVCCDHGLLGLALFKKTNINSIHLIDQVPQIIDILKQKYSHLNDGRLIFSTQDAKCIRLAKDRKHLIIIAGVGGENLIDILKNITDHNPSAQIDFALSPNSHLYEVRLFLKNNFTLLQEDLLKEGNRFHEHIFVRFTPNCIPSITLTGTSFWKTSPLAKPYQKKLIKHYSLINTYHPTTISQHALEAYLSLDL